MRVCIPIEDRLEGGLYTFLRYFRRYLGARGHELTEDPTRECDALFVNSFVVPFEVVRQTRTRWPRARVVQRVDGSAQDYGRGGDADVQQARVNLLADLTIFQSRYGRFSVTRKYRLMPRRGVVIPNPVDTERFTPDGPRESLPGATRVVCVTYSTNPRKGIGVLAGLADANRDVQVILAGRHGAETFPPNVACLGEVDHQRLPAILRSCDAMVFLSENETCPNVVLEGLASGLPVLYADSGGTRELVGDAGLPVTKRDFRVRLEEAMGRRVALSTEARRRAHTLFSVGAVLGRYERAISRCRRRRMPPAFRLAWRVLAGYEILPGGRQDGWSRLRFLADRGCASVFASYGRGGKT